MPIGILLDRFSARNINSIGIAFWSLAMAATAGVWSFATLIVARMVMGAGEATSIPSCGRIVREWMPAQERGVANAFWSAGSFLGPALGAVVTAAIASSLGLARRLHHPRRPRFCLARLQSDLVRPAGKGELAVGRRTQENTDRTLRRFARRSRRSWQSRRGAGTAASRRRNGAR